jgi:HTH-type transcriptional regulator/antitoxin HipB
MEQRIISIQHLGSALRTARKEKGITQGQVAKSMGLDQPSLSKIERGESSVRVDTLLRLIAALDLDLIIQPRHKGEEFREGDSW